jgi:hypothetical protein
MRSLNESECRKKGIMKVISERCKIHGTNHWLEFFKIIVNIELTTTFLLCDTFDNIDLTIHL